MLPGLRPDLPVRPPALSFAAVRPSEFRSHSLVACPSASAIPMFPTSPPSYLLLPPPPARLTPVPSGIAFAASVVPSCHGPLGPTLSVAVVCNKRDNKSEKKKRGE